MMASQPKHASELMDVAWLTNFQPVDSPRKLNVKYDLVSDPTLLELHRECHLL